MHSYWQNHLQVHNRKIITPCYLSKWDVFIQAVLKRVDRYKDNLSIPNLETQKKTCHYEMYFYIVGVVCIPSSSKGLLENDGGGLCHQSSCNLDLFCALRSKRLIRNSPFILQVLHRDIESRSQLIKTVLEQCSDLDAARSKHRSRRRKGSAAAGETSHKISVSLLSVGKIIEKRWHCLWLRSLEWQCFLEQFTSKQVRLPILFSFIGSKYQDHHQIL